MDFEPCLESETFCYKMSFFGYIRLFYKSSVVASRLTRRLTT